jgi:hypothetical protein
VVGEAATLMRGMGSGKRSADGRGELVGCRRRQDSASRRWLLTGTTLLERRRLL